MQVGNTVLYNVIINGHHDDFTAQVNDRAVPQNSGDALENDVAVKLMRASIIDDAVSLAVGLKDAFRFGGLSPAEACSISIDYVLSRKGICYVIVNGFEMNAELFSHCGNTEAIDMYNGLTTTFREKSATTCRYIENELENIRLKTDAMVAGTNMN